MNTYTIVLLYPNWIDTGDGDNAYCDQITAPDVDQAIAKARNDVMEDCLEIDDPEDLTVVCVVEGGTLNPE